MRGGASITLEPGAQLELSGDKAENIHQVCAELRAHLREIAPISKAMGVRWLGVGFHPFARREDFAWVPKQRYGVMREYLPTRGGHALDMMLRTCTVQVNLDYASEADAMRKMRVVAGARARDDGDVREQPVEGGTPARRRHLPRPRLARRRSGSLGPVPALWKRTQPLRRLRRVGARRADVPLQARRPRDREHRADVPAFLKSGFEGHRPTMEDWKTHLNTLFPEVRLKKTIEVRGADAQSADMACALPALWTGILYDDRALAEAEALVEGWTLRRGRRAPLARLARRAARRRSAGGTLVEVAERMVAIAEGGLERRAIVDPASGKDERVHLARLRKLVGDGHCPADVLLEGIEREADLAGAIVERTTLR